MRHQGPLLKAALAALTARSTSAACASATWQISSPVVGLVVGNVLPDSLSTHSLLIKSFVARTATHGSRMADTVAIGTSTIHEVSFRRSIGSLVAQTAVAIAIQ